MEPQVPSWGGAEGKSGKRGSQPQGALAKNRPCACCRWQMHSCDPGMSFLRIFMPILKMALLSRNVVEGSSYGTEVLLRSTMI